MAVEELLLYFLVVPAAGYVASALWVRASMRKIAEREIGFLRDPRTTSRYGFFLVLFATPIVFGVAILFQAMQALPAPTVDQALRSLGWTYATAALLTVVSEAWIVVRWKASSFREMFGRILIFTVIPEVVFVWVLTFALLALGLVVRDSVEPPISQVSADALSRANGIMTIGAFAAPLSAFLGNRHTALDLQNFRKVLLWMVLGVTPATVCLSLAIALLPLY